MEARRFQPSGVVGIYLVGLDNCPSPWSSLFDQSLNSLTKVQVRAHGVPMPKISIVVRSYNEDLHIQKLLTGIASQSLKDVEVILVDSGSTDETVQVAEKNGVRIVKIPKSEFSFGRALNRGCEAATGDILVFASAHVYPVRTDWLQKLTEPFDDDRIVLTYGRQVGNKVSKFSEHQVFRSWFPQKTIQKQGNNFCNNANCAIRRTEWEKQKYDEVLTGLEDIAWAKQARQRGGQIAYIADAMIVHVHDETWGRIRNRYQREAIALSQIEPNLKFSFVDFLVATATNVFHDIEEARRLQKLRLEFGSILLFRFNQFFGTWRGYRSRGKVDAALQQKFYYPPSIAKEATIEATSTTTENLTIRYER